VPGPNSTTSEAGPSPVTLEQGRLGRGAGVLLVVVAARVPGVEVLATGEAALVREPGWFRVRRHRLIVAFAAACGE